MEKDIGNKGEENNLPDGLVRKDIISDGSGSPSSYSKRKKKDHPKKDFSLSGIFLIIVAVFCLILSNYVPWAYVQYEDGEASGEEIIYSGYKETDFVNKEIRNFFKFPNNMGVYINDFTDTPNSVFYGSVSLIILGFLFIAFQTLDRIKDFTEGFFATFHSIFALFTIVISFFMALSVTKFLSAYFLMYENINLITESIPAVVFLAPILIFVLTLGIIKATFMIFRINIKKIEKRTNLETM